MQSRHPRLRAVALGTLLALTCGSPAVADDTEIFVGRQSGARPNILLILDTSGSMNGAVSTQVLYDPSVTYGGTCSASRVYWRRDTGDPPDCGDDTWINASELTCDAATQALAAAGTYVADRAAQWNPGSSQLRWENIRSGVSNQPVECRADAGQHGAAAGDPEVFASGTAGEQWTADGAQQIGWTANNTDRTYTFYSGNWLNWYYDPGSFVTSTRLAVVQEVAVNLVNTISGVNMGLMRYSNNGGSGDASAEGGMVTFPVTPVETARSQLEASINSNTADGSTPLSETLFEAQQYFAGRPVFFGIDSQIRPGEPLPSVPESRLSADPAFYRSPAELSCQKNFVVYLTDGEPTQDNSADDDIIALSDFDTLVGSDCDDSGSGRCLDDLAEYMFDADLRPSVQGQQNVVTYTIGFGPDVAGSTFLQRVAQRGGGSAFSADNVGSLTTALSNIVNEILQTGTTFVSPSVAVNAFNRTETLSDIYLSIFEPSTTYHWPGNFKKYQIAGGQLVDATGAPAVDAATGFLRPGSRSLWASGADGGDVSAGGAAARLPVDPAQRRLYTFLADPDLTASTNRITANNGLLTDLLLSVGLPGQPTRAQILDFALGFDVQDADNDGDTTDARLEMGDPLHGRPATVIYGGSSGSPNINDAVLYTTTNDGYLHAIDAFTGDELWAFIPAELLQRLVDLYEDDPQSSKRYGLDGDVRAVKIDRDQDGIVEPSDGDRVHLYFGMRRGGNNYYALDVTRKNSPEHLWTIGPAQLPGVGQSWSTPAVTRVEVAGATQNSDRLALVFGGGYDETQDNDQGSTFYNTDTIGNRVFMVDALSGARLWFAGGPGIGSPNLDLPRMDNSIPSPVRVIDLDGDGFGDRMYVGDTGGRVWRFDIIVDDNPTAAGNQAPNADSLVAGGVLATLGNADAGAQPIASTRHFYHTPDVALVSRRGAPAYFNIALGSGWRGHPLNTGIQDRFYALRDFEPFTKLSQAQYNSRTPIEDDDLVDITDNVAPVLPINSAGWKLELRLPGGFVGEKVLAESRTLDNVVFFPTYLPTETSADPCLPAGSNRVYAVRVDDGSPPQDINRDGQIEPTDRWTNVGVNTILGEVTFLINQQGQGLPGGPPGSAPPCLAGLQAFEGCLNPNTFFRTYWRRGVP